MDGPKRAKCVSHNLVGLGHGHWGIEATEGDTKELLHNLKTDRSITRVESIGYQAGRHSLLGRMFSASFVDENVGVEKKAIVHSSRRECRDRQSQCVSGVP